MTSPSNLCRPCWSATDVCHRLARVCVWERATTMSIMRAAIALLVLVFASEARAADDAMTCNDLLARSREDIAACTRIISSKRAKGRELAEAYYGRGMKYRLEKR